METSSCRSTRISSSTFLGRQACISRWCSVSFRELAQYVNGLMRNLMRCQSPLKVYDSCPMCNRVRYISGSSPWHTLWHLGIIVVSATNFVYMNWCGWHKTNTRCMCSWMRFIFAKRSAAQRTYRWDVEIYRIMSFIWKPILNWARKFENYFRLLFVSIFPLRYAHCGYIASSGCI